MREPGRRGETRTLNRKTAVQATLASGRLRTAVVVALVVCVAIVTLFVGCSSGKAHDRPRKPSSEKTSAPSSSASPSTTGPDVSAKAAYWGFDRASRAAEQQPRNPQLISTIGRWAVDPALVTEAQNLAGFSLGGVAFKGTPPTPRMAVASTKLDAKPYPTVTLSDCPTPAPSWRAYYVASGKPVAIASAPAPPPYEITVEVILYKNKWMVYTTKADRRHTCSP